jgi:hypothetical protein
VSPDRGRARHASRGIPQGGRPTGSLVALALLASVAGLLARPAALPAQARALVAGRVMQIQQRDTVGRAGARVVLHRVGRQLQGPVDSTTAGPDGSFRFRFIPDTAAVYLLSSGYAGIEYFSTPVHSNPAQPDTGLILFVSDTSSRAPIHVASRHLVISKPGADGTRAALEIVVLENDGPDTRVAPDSLSPAWSTRLPRGALGFQVGQGDVGPDGLLLRNDSVLMLSPVAPGQKQLLYTYALPASPGRVRLPVSDSIAVANLLLEEFDRQVTGGQIVKADSQTIEGRHFQQWVGPVPAGAVIEIDFPASSTSWLLPVLVGVVALSLGLVALRVLRRPPAPSPAASHRPALEQLAKLDTRYAGRQAEVSADEWATYQADRARLKQQLAAELAGKRGLS